MFSNARYSSIKCVKRTSFALYRLLHQNGVQSERLATKVIENVSVITHTNDSRVDKTDVANVSHTETSEISIRKPEKSELTVPAIPKPLDYDSIWEYQSAEQIKPYSKITNYFSVLNPEKPVNYMTMKQILMILHMRVDFSWAGFKRRLKFYIEYREMYNQRYIARRHGILGPDLATAHFFTYRGGKVQFRHLGDIWIADHDLLPNKHDRVFQLTKVDASNCKLRYEALDNLTVLPHLSELNLSGNNLIDDWFCDKIARLFRNSTKLAVLDLSDAPLVTNRGIEALHRIKSLRKLIIKGTKAAQHPFIDLLIILFHDVNPECEIIA